MVEEQKRLLNGSQVKKQQLNDPMSKCLIIDSLDNCNAFSLKNQYPTNSWSQLLDL